MFTVDELVDQHLPIMANRPLLAPPAKLLLRHLLQEKQFLKFQEQYPYLQGIDFIEQVLEYFHFTFTLSERDRENIPTEGRVIIFANHPIGTLDGLALLKLVHTVRSDVQIVANDFLMSLQPLHSFLLPVKIFGGNTTRTNITKIEQALTREAAVLIFPAGEVSRFGPKGVKDGKWQKGFLRLASRAKAPILPIHIQGRNSCSFYAASTIAKPLSTLMLISEMFKQKNNSIKLSIGAIIPFSAYSKLDLPEKEKTRLLRKHLYRIGAGKKPIFKTEKAIASPERKLDLKRAVARGEHLGSTPDGKEILLFTSSQSSPVIREIARLREITFRMVGEGSGKRRDIDSYDSYYHHLILWSAEELEIVGAYRFADAEKVMATKGIKGLYTNSLFHFNQDAEFLRSGLELGRSFVQQKYWGKRSLDYLWFGIGAYLSHHPEHRYLFGPVSISNTMPPHAKELLVYFYRLYFSLDQADSFSRNPFQHSLSAAKLAEEFSGQDYPRDFKHLKALLGNMGCSVPTLFKQYTELCKPGGAVFLDFNVDPDFSNCIDGLVVVEIKQIKPKKRRRYLQKGPPN